MLTDLIKDMHNSNYQTNQITLSGEIIEEEKFYVLGFVSAEIIGLRKEVWFCKLDSEQISKIEEFLDKQAMDFA